VPIAYYFKGRFIRDAHRLVAEGYARLDPATLTKKSEEAISGRIVDEVKAWFDQKETPAWTESYFITSESPEKSDKREGKRRPRIDIFVECSKRRPCAGFAFEAKRFYRSDSVAQYVGPKGLGAFLNGTHASGAPSAGMLGFVQKGSKDGHIEKVCEKLGAERNLHGLAEKGDVWRAMSLDDRLGMTWVSHHERAAPQPTMKIYHSFLRCSPKS
jgi:hypothetical protein